MAVASNEGWKQEFFEEFRVPGSFLRLFQAAFANAPLEQCLH